MVEEGKRLIIEGETSIEEVLRTIREEQDNAIL